MAAVPFPRKEFLAISAAIEDYHKVFYTFWEMSDVLIDDDFPTACVQFFPNAKPRMMFGRAFWEKLTFREKLFVVCHECLHVILDHGMRNGMDVKGATHSLVNVAQDITINEMIVDLFGFDREEITDWKNLCWIDTCFDDPNSIRRHQTFKYYLELLIKQDRKSDMPKTLDQHNGSPSKGSGSPGDPQPQKPTTPSHAGGEGDDETEDEKKERAKIAEKLAAELNPGELQDLLDAVEKGDAGSLSGMLDHVLTRKKKLPKVKFTSFIKKLKRTRLKVNPHESDSFARDTRRFDDVVRTFGAILPGPEERDKPIKDKLLCFVFWDVSGSCIPYKSVFQDVFFAFDAEREIFETRLFIFDVKVTEVKERDSPRIGGGTSFHIIEDAIQKLKPEYGDKYPDCVVVITDGDGDVVEPAAPNRWIWLLAPPANRRLIPAQSQKFLIDQVVF